MSRQTAGKAASWGRARRAFSLGALGTLLAACSSVGGGPVRTPEPSSYQDVPVSLDGSLATAEGTWAVIKMGHLDQFANTFWQLLVLHRGDTRWSLVTPPGFADNGGLVANSVDGKSLVTGFQANQLDHFSPLAVTSDGGRSWAPGLLAQGLASVPDALAVSTSGEILALVGGGAPSVLTSSGDLSQWQPLVSEKSLATSAAGQTCAVTRMTAVGFAPGGQPIVGASCSKPGSVGLFEYTNGVWHSFAPRLPTSTSHATVQVVRLLSLNGTVSAIVAVQRGLRCEADRHALSATTESVGAIGCARHAGVRPGALLRDDLWWCLRRSLERQVRTRRSGDDSEWLVGAIADGPGWYRDDRVRLERPG